MHLFLRLLIFLCVSSGCRALPRLKSVRLEVLDQNFVRLLVGNPPRHHLFYVDLTSSDIALHDQSFELHSHSIELPTGAGRGSELFYLDAYTLRLPFAYAAPSIGHTVRLVSSFSASGTLGLGPWSPLWMHWDNFSLSQQNLLLGGYDIYNQLDSAERPPVFPNGEGRCRSVEAGPEVPFHIDFNQLDTRLPADLFAENPKHLRLEGSSCRELYRLLNIQTDTKECNDVYTVPFHVQEISLLTGVSYRAVQHSHDGRVHFGKRFLEDFVLFCDFKEDMLLFAESSSSFFVSESNALFVVLLLFAGWTWLLLAFGAVKATSVQSAPTQRLHNWVLLYIESFLYIAIIACWTVNFVGFKWRRFMRSFQQQDSEFFLIYHAVVILTCAGVGLLRIATRLLCGRAGKRAHSSGASLLSLVLLANSLLPVLWSCFLPQHRYSSDLVFLVFFATTLCVGNGVVALYLAVHRRLRGLVFLVPLTGLAYYALVWGNLLPIHSTLGVLQSRLIFVGSYLAIVCVFTTAYTASRVLVSEARQQVRTTSAATPSADSQPPPLDITTTDAVANKMLELQLYYFTALGADGE